MELALAGGLAALVLSLFFSQQREAEDLAGGSWELNPMLVLGTFLLAFPDKQGHHALQVAGGAR